MHPFHPKIYGTTVMNDKGQVVIPADARASLGIEPGTRLVILGAPVDGSVMVMKASIMEDRAKSWLNELQKPNDTQQGTE